MQEEIWKDVPGYEELYQVSNLGRVRSLDRVTQGVDGITRFYNGRVLKHYLSKGYLRHALSINGIAQTYQVHQLVAKAFLNHKPNGLNLVVDHINNIKTDNRLENLQVVTNRHNSTKDLKGSSKFPGVSWDNRVKKWKARIFINGKTAHLGRFTDENDAALAYQNALKELA